MVAPETLILLSLPLLNALFFLGFALWMRRLLDEAVDELDLRLAPALKALMDRVVGEDGLNVEPPNPVQVAIGQMIQAFAQQKMTTIEAQITERADNGQFQSKPTESSEN